ncbi:MAG: aminotransferase class V-fold PLP-dependent enzyme [Isosphaeraceae bacterium]
MSDRSKDEGARKAGTRRGFLGGLAVGTAHALFRRDAIARSFGAGRDAEGEPAGDLAGNEDYWSQIARCFDADRTLINFNNGGVSPSPTHVLDQMIRDLRFCNELPAYHMWQVLEPRIETVRRALAQQFGCDPEELAITRNASEGMETLILGLDLKRGDEVIVTDHNYGRMLNTWDQRARRDGIVVKSVSFPVPLESPGLFVERIKQAITPKTRVIEFPHITNLTGQILPVRDVVRLARERGILVFVDGAHSFAHFPFTRDQLDCDFFATSLHKWLLAPIGTGFLYVRKSRLKTIWPLMAAPPSMDENIRKYEEIGTHPAANHNAIAAALAFHQSIGDERKAARLRYLRNRWATPLQQSCKCVTIWTPLDDDNASCGIALVHIDGIEPAKLSDHLFSRYKIFTVAITHKDFSGIRVTPNVYTTPKEIELFVEAMHQVVTKGIS